MREWRRKHKHRAEAVMAPVLTGVQVIWLQTLKHKKNQPGVMWFCYQNRLAFYAIEALFFQDL